MLEKEERAIETLVKIPKQEYRERVHRIQDELLNRSVSGLLVTSPYNIYYTTGLFHFPTERPILLFIPQAGEPTLFVPIMEKEEAKEVTCIEDIRDYFEFPGLVHPLDWALDEITKTWSNLKEISVDHVPHSTYQRVSERLSRVLVKVDSMIEDMRLCKSNNEIQLLQTAASYADYIVSQGLHYANPGLSELEVLQEITNRTLNKMISELGEVIYVPGGPAGGLVPSGVRTSLPHALPSAKRLEKGDTFILSCGANVGGYRTECERTCFIGDVTTQQEKVFRVMAEAQQLAIEAMRPGMSCAQVDQIALDYIRQKGYGEFLLHRTGHGKGLEEHEGPWIDEGDPTVLKPGMILSSEPGIYISGFSGFRHSDTIVVTEDEPLVLTKFPKSLDQLIIPIK
jgi:Xaa-Pro dipeptidase